MDIHSIISILNRSAKSGSILKRIRTENYFHRKKFYFQNHEMRVDSLVGPERKLFLGVTKIADVVT